MKNRAAYLSQIIPPSNKYRWRVRRFVAAYLSQIIPPEWYTARRTRRNPVAAQQSQKRIPPYRHLYIGTGGIESRSPKATVPRIKLGAWRA